MNNKLTDEQTITLQLRIMSAKSFYSQCGGMAAHEAFELLTLCGIAVSELQERRKAAYEPLAYTTEFYLQELNKSGLYQCWLSRDARNAEYSVPIFAASQSATLPPEMPAHTGPRQDGRPQAYADGWNACRDAMQYELQERRKASAEPIYEYYPDDGWVECSKELYDEMVRLGYDARIVYAAPQPAPDSEAQATPITQCPFPCGWDELNKLAIQDAAAVARGLVDGELVTEANRQAVIANNDRLLKIISFCRTATLQLSGNTEQLNPASGKGV